MARFEPEHQKNGSGKRSAHKIKKDVTICFRTSTDIRSYLETIAQEKRLSRTVQGWSNVLALWEAMKRADKAGALTGESILKQGFHTMKDFDLGLGGAKLTYTETDHRVSGQVPVYEYKGGKFQRVAVVDLKGRWPDKWQSWLGW